VEAKFADPFDLDISEDGTILYLSDKSNQKVRQIDLAN